MLDQTWKKFCALTETQIQVRWFLSVFFHCQTLIHFEKCSFPIKRVHDFYYSQPFSTFLSEHLSEYRERFTAHGWKINACTTYIFWGVTLQLCKINRHKVYFWYIMSFPTAPLTIRVYISYFTGKISVDSNCRKILHILKTEPVNSHFWTFIY